MGDDLVAALTDDLQIFVETPPLQGEGLFAFARRLTGEDASVTAITAANAGAVKLLAGVRYRVPYPLLRDELKLRAIQALFNGDAVGSDGWQHRVARSGQESYLWRLSEWFTGRGEWFSRIRDHNQLDDNSLEQGTRLVIPAALLLPPFRTALASSTPLLYGLEYVKDATSQYAVYRLRPGEALYSSVVVRFTGRTFAEDVNALARELATLNGIHDVTDIATGQPIRIPFEHLLPEFLPLDDPRRQGYEKVRSESEQYSNTVRSTRLEGVTVILDAGHGGMDPGVIRDGVWESVYVYDVMLRVKHLLETTTAATVAPTIRDGNGFRIHDGDVLPASRGAELLTTPRHPILETRVSVNLRWYLANSLHAAAVKAGRKSDEVIFVSLHADSLHSSLRGAMAYVPATSLTGGEYGNHGAAYARHHEVRERPRVSFTWKQRVRSEGLSRQLAEKLIGSFRRRGLPVHPEQPIRDRIIRSRRWVFVPAVLRYNAVPAKLLLEICNLNNAEDRRLLKTRAFRQRVAEAVVDGILDYYGPSSPPSQLAATAR